MEQAKKYLRQDCKIKEAALLSGFGDVNYFSKVFKKMTGLSPKEYQKKICD
ncbi:MAG: helix-turn-helix domain-containing protein, partial [Lachnospiraceae bacterium]|nr:helix-turn-helix domain-containing protein [Lachnospiraceae bacterium]